MGPVNGPHPIFSAFSATEVTETTEQKLECRNNGLDILFFLPILPIFHYSINLFIFLCALRVLCGGNSSAEAWKRNLYSLWAVEFLSVLGMALILLFLSFYVRELGINRSSLLIGNVAGPISGGFLGAALGTRLVFIYTAFLLIGVTFGAKHFIKEPPH
jgi:MFS family permease